MTIGVWELAARLPGWKERVRYLVRLWLSWPWVAPLLRLLSASGFAPLLRKDPMLLHRARRPYLAASWSRRQRLRVVMSHYRFVQNRLGLRFAAPVYFGDGLVLARLEPSGYQLQLGYTTRFGHEGELTLSLGRSGESRKLSSLSFTVDATEPQRPRMRIGCVQADDGEDTLDRMREFTRQHHGMRPKPLLIWTARQLAAWLRLEQVCGIGDAYHVYRHAHYQHCQGTQLLSRYDELWQDAGAAAAGEWFGMAPGNPRRDPASIPAKKRAQYARRYAWLDQLELDMNRVLAPLGRAVPVKESRAVDRIEPVWAPAAAVTLPD